MPTSIWKPAYIAIPWPIARRQSEPVTATLGGKQKHVKILDANRKGQGRVAIWRKQNALKRTDLSLPLAEIVGGDSPISLRQHKHISRGASLAVD